MTITSRLYAQRIAECEADAAAATLDRVKDRALRSRASWQKLLDQDDHFRVMRSTAAAAKLAGN